MNVQFLTGSGRHYRNVNYLIGDNDLLSLYAEVEVPDKASDDYGYITMKNALSSLLSDDELKEISWQYDGQEQFLADDASVECNVYATVDREDE